MKRLYFVRDERGQRPLSESEFPLTIGGRDVADIVLPDFEADRRVAYLALSDGHAFLQPDGHDTGVFHNGERLKQSVWLKSGDVIQIEQVRLSWLIHGDQVVIGVVGPASLGHGVLVPPSGPPEPDRRVQPQYPSDHEPSLPDVSSQGRRASGLHYLAAGLLGSLLLTAAFVFFATPLKVVVEPQPEHMSIHGFPPPVPALGRYLSLPGQYTLQASLDGYEPLREVLNVDDTGGGEFRFALQPLPGLLAIEIRPKVPFSLVVDGEEAAANEQGLFSVAQGTHRLRIETERFLPEERKFEVEGLGRQQRLEFRLRPAWADVRVTTEPAGATVYVDGDRRGETPLRTEIMQGIRVLELALSRHKTLTLNQQVNAGEQLALEGIQLTPADGTLSITSEPAGATVSIGGEFLGRTPLDLPVPSGQELTLSLIKAGYVPFTKTVTLEPEEERALQADLSVEMGTVFLASEPADASLLIDGRPAGSATQRLRLSTRPHRLEVRRPGYVSERLTVTPSAGVSQSLEVDLRPSAQGRDGVARARSSAGAVERYSATGDYGLALIRPSGPFSMGASRREPGRRANEARRSVELSRPFYLGAREVTNAQFRRFRPDHRAGIADGVDLDAAEQPVVNVSWEDAARYCNWLSAQEGRPSAYEEHAGTLRLVQPLNNGYRLPTEAEWAYAARIHQRSQAARYPWPGNYPPGSVSGNYADAGIADTLADVVPSGYDDGHRGPAPVGSYPASPGGFYDLGGNVAEWINDYYTVYPAAAQSLVKDPMGPDSGQHRVVRGSGWRHANITELRLSYRDYSKRPRIDLGFRVARYVD